MEEIVKKIVTVLDKKKAEDIVAIRIRDLTILADQFIIATGTSGVHIRSLADEVEEELKKDGIAPHAIEGKATGWVLMDYSDTVVHLFTPEARDYYKLERLWTDGERLDISAYLTEN